MNRIEKSNIYQALSKLEIKINTDYHLIHSHQDISKLDV